MYPRRQTPIQNTLRSVSLLVLLAFGANASGQADGTAPLASDSGVTTLEQDGFSGGVSLNGTYFDVRHQTGKGVGYSSDGFTQFGLFTPFWGSNDNWFIAPNARVNLTNDSRSGFNAGLVSRLYSEQFDRIVGVNAYWDNDKSQLNNRYDQVGFGFETLGPILDFRANAYVPTTNESNFVRATGLSTDLAFFGNRLGLLGTQVVESALKGYDFEFGVPLTPSTPWLRGYAGMYAYQQNAGTEPVGFRGRVEGWISSDTSLGFMVTHDKHFGTNVNATIDWRFAGFVPTRYFPNFSTRDRMLMPVQRSWRITASQYEEEVNVLADNPRTGNNYFVVWVDPNRTAGTPGTGTYENPFHAMPNNVPNQTDLVLVRRGDTTAVDPLNGQINLPHNTRMLGEGHAHILDATASFGGVTQTVNDALLPDAGFRNTGLYPFLSNPASDIVRVGNGNEVAAFVMNGAGGAAITGPNVRGFHFHHLEISNNAGGGIVLPGAGGTGLVTPDGQTILGGRIADINRNLVGGWANPGGLGNNGGPGGIDIATGISPLELVLERVSMNSSPAVQDYGVRLRTLQGALDTRFEDVSTSGGHSVAGTSLEQTTGRLTATLNRLQTSDNDGNGLRLLTGSQRPMTVLGTNITADRNGGDNLLIANNPAAPGLLNATFDGVFSRSSFDGSINGNGVSLNMTNGIKSLSLTDVSASGNALSGVDLVSTGGTLNLNATRLTANDNTGHNLNALLANTRFTGVVTDSTFDRSLATGVRLDATGGQSALLLMNVSASENQFGLVVNGHGGAQIGNAATAAFDGVSVIDSTLTGNIFDAVQTLAEGGSHVELFVDPTDLSGSGRHAFRFDVREASDLAGFFDQVLMNDNGQNPGAVDVIGAGRGVFGLVDGTGSRANVTVQNSQILRSADDGVYVRTTNEAIANVNLTDVAILDSGRTEPGASGIEVNAESASLINLTVSGLTTASNSAIGGSADFGLTVESRGFGTVVNATATGTQFDNARTNALQVFVDNGQATITLTDTTGNNAGASGVDAVVHTNGVLDLEFTNADFLAAGRAAEGDGLNALADSGSLLNACLVSSDFNGASGAGLRFRSLDAGTEANVQFETGTANDNLRGGLVADALAGGSLNLRTVGSSFDGNGTPGALDFDGVFVRADGAGSAARLLFNTTTADNNSNNGFNFEAAGGAFMTARIDSVSASNNGGYGVRLDAQDMGTSALLLPTGVNTIAGNGLGSYSVNYNNVNLAVIALTGSFDGVAGDGIHIDINNVGTAVVSLTGDGTDTIDNNTGDGVDIRIANADTVGIRIAGYNSISGNTEDGVHIVLTDVATAAAIEILGPTAMTNNGDNGVDITLFNVALGPFVAPPGLDPLSVITLDDNNVANICLPTPVDVPFSTFVTVPASDGILVDGLTISRVAAPAGQDGIAINGTNVSGSGLVALTNNSINNYDNGIDANFGGASLFGGLTIDNTVVTNSATSGIGVTTNGSGVPITITGTTVSASGGTGLNVQLTNAIGGSNVILDNVTVTNSGGAGVAILGDGNFGNVSLTNVSATNSTVGDGVSVVLANGSVDTVTLNNVSSRTSGGDGVRVDLNGLNVATAVTVNGQGTAVANDSAGDGVVVSLVNVTGTPGLSVGGYASVNNNGGRGIAVSATGTDVGVVDLSNNTVGFSNGGDGIQLVLDSNVAGPVLLSNNIVDNSFDDGISLVLDNVTGGPDVSTINSTVTNSGGFGITLTANNATLGNILLDPIVVTNSAGGDGVLVGLTNSSANSILVDRVSVDTSAARGINIDLNNVSGLQSVVVTGPASVLNSTSDGIRIGLNNVTGGPDVAVRSMVVDQSGGRGIAIESSNATTLGDVSVVNTTIRNSGAQGMLVDLGPGAVGSVLIDVNSVSDSGGRGVDVNLDGVTGAPGVTVRNTTALRSGGRGISVAGSAATLGNVVLTNVSSDTTTANEGVAVVFDTNSTTGSIGLNNVSAVRSAAGGILLDLNAVMLTGAAPTIIINGQNTAVATNNGGDGIFMNLTNVTGATAAPDLYITNYNLVDQNAGRGIALDSNGSAVGAVSVSSNSVSNSTAGQGIQIDLTGSSVGSLLVADDSIRDSSGRGVDVILDNVTGSPSVSVRNTTALRSGGRGVSVEGSGATLANVSLSNVSSDTTTADEGVAVIFDTASTTGSIGLSNVSATRSTAGGILVDLNTVTMTGVNPGVSINGLNTAQSTNNGGDGILARLNAVTGAVVAPDVNVSNYLLVDQNAGRGIGIESNGSNVDAVTVLNNIVSNSTAGQGIQVDLTGSGLRSLIVDFNTITDSSDRGLDVILDTVTGSSTIAVRNTTAARSGGRGISVEGSTATLGSVTLLNVSSTTTAADEGVAVVFDTNSTVGPIVLNNVSATLSNAGGILVDLNTVAMTGPNAGINVNGLGTAQSTINGGDGILVNLNVVTGSPDVSVSNYLLIDQNAGRGIGVLGIGSVLDDVTVSDNIVSNSTAGQGIQINLTNSTVGSLVADNNTISDSSDRGFDVILDGTIGSPDITISDLSVARSGGRGVSVAGSGSTLGNATLSNVLSNTTTTGEGVAVVLDNGTVGSVLLNNVSANLSAAGGILVDLNTMNVGPSVIVDGLGTAVVTDNVGDGIFVNLTGVTGTPNVGIDNQGFVDNNAGRGIALDTNGSAVGAVSLSNNFIDRSTAGQGMLVDLTGSNVGSLLVDSNTIANSFGRGLDVLLDNVTGTPAISISNTTVTASGGRGVSVEGTGATLGDVSLTNVSSETTTTEEGVAIILDNGTVGSILLNNVSATASFAGGILVDLNTMNVGGDIVVDAQGVAVSDDNGGDGIFVNLVGVNGTPNVNIDGYISVDNNAGRGIALFSDGPTLGDVSISRNVVSNSTGGDGVQVVMTNAALASLTVDGNQVTISRDNGINIDLTASSIVADNGSILNNTINTSLNGDGLRLAFSTVTADGFLIDFNNSQSNSDNGFNLDFTNSPIDRLTITNNSGGVAVNTALTFFITGDTNTQPFAITNSSDPGVLLQSFSLNLLTAVPQPLLFDTVTPAGAVAFQPTAPTDVTTGLTTVNGTAITQGTNPLQDSMGVVLVGGGVPDDSSQFTLGFNDFDPSETFNWSIDVDPFGGTAGVFGNELIGSTVNVTFSGGLSLGGTLMAVAGDPLASTFVATSGNVAGNGIANNGLDGVRFSLNNSSLTNMLMDNNQIEFNGTSGTGHGVNFATVNNSDITLANISNNEIDGNAGDGFRLINPDTAGAVIGLTFEDNEITTNTGTGIELQIDNAEIANIAINSVATGNQISSNGIAGATNGFGVHLSAIDTAQYTLNVGGAGPIVNTFDGNRNAGIAVEATDMTVGAITLSNTTLSGTLAGGNVSFAGDGFSLRTAQQAQVTALTIGDAAVRNTLFDENVGDGITVNAIENSQFTNGLLIQNISSTGNNSDGISITRRDDALFSNDVNANNIIENGEAHVVLNNVIATGNSANGLNVLVTNAQLPITRIDIADTTNDAVADSRFDSNGTGMRFTGSADAVLVVNASDTSASNNDNGVIITLSNNSTIGDMIPGLGNVNNPASIASTFNGMTISNNANVGFGVTTNDATLANITMTNSALTGARNFLNGNRGNSIQLTANSSSAANFDFDAVNITNTAGAVTGDGLNVVANASSNVTLRLTDAFIGNVIPTTVLPGMTGDGIDITSTSNSNVTFNLGDDLATGVVDVGIYGNGGNGIVIRNNESSTFTGNLNNVASRFNDGRGYSAQMSAAATGNGNYIHNIDDSSFGENGREGIAFITNAGTHNQDQSGPLLFGNTGFPGDNRPFPIGDGNDFLNLNTDLDAQLTLTNSLVQNNGTVANSNGLVIAVSTNSTVQADVRGNTFSGNTLDDLATSSFITTNGGFDANGNATGAAIQTNASVNTNGVGTFDSVFQDDTAQLDLRFLRNTGDQVNVTSLGAIYAADAAKAGGNRRADIFQVNAFHTSTMQAGSTTTSILSAPADVVALDASVTDPAGIVNVANFYQNVNPNRFTSVRLENVTNPGATGLIAANTNTGTFDLTGNAVGNANAGDVFRVFLLDTNVFNQSGAPQDVHAAFTNNFFTQFGADSNGPGGGNPFPGATTPTATYFNFPDAVFP